MKSFIYLPFLIILTAILFYRCEISSCSDEYDVRFENRSSGSDYAVVIDDDINQKTVIPYTPVSGGEYPSVTFKIPVGEHKVDFYENNATLSNILCTGSFTIEDCELDQHVLSCDQDGTTSNGEFRAIISGGRWAITAINTPNSDGVYSVIEYDLCDADHVTFNEDGTSFVDTGYPGCAEYVNMTSTSDWIATDSYLEYWHYGNPQFLHITEYSNDSFKGYTESTQDWYIYTRH